MEAVGTADGGTDPLHYNYSISDQQTVSFHILLFQLQLEFDHGRAFPIMATTSVARTMVATGASSGLVITPSLSCFSPFY